MSDQHNPHVIGCAGDSVVHTPNLDALASRGVRFARAYCANPLCVPSRSTFLTAQRSSDIGVWYNQDVLPSHVPTIAHSLGAAGYETVLCGRMDFFGPDQWHGFEKRLVGDVSRAWPDEPHCLAEPVPPVAASQTRKCLEFVGPGRTAYQAFDRDVTAAAIRYLEDHTRSAQRPFLLVVGYVLPHCPYICPRQLFEYYLDRVSVPRPSPEELSVLHPALLRRKESSGEDSVPDETARTARAAYYGLVTLIDEQVGKVLSALRRLRLDENTAVFYTSDHGDMAGEHGMWWKNLLYEGSVGVPLIAAFPGHFAEAAVVPNPVSLLDLAETLTALGNGPRLPQSRGRSLLPFLEGIGAPDGWCDDVFAENGHRYDEPPSCMVVRGRWKLVHYHGWEVPQLFDLGDDPGETRDRASDPALRSTREMLHALAREGFDGAALLRRYDLSVARLDLIRQWASCVRRAPLGPKWVPPQGCNVFPEA